MRLLVFNVVLATIAATASVTTEASTQRITDLVHRRLPKHVDEFFFASIHPRYPSNVSKRLNHSGYFGKPWISCEFHGCGANNGLYGQVENITLNVPEALKNSSSMVGIDLTREGQEGNEVMYDMLLDQAWSKEPLDTSVYFTTFAAARYGPEKLPASVDLAWQKLLHSVYNNTNLTTRAVTKSILELRPNSTGLLGCIGRHPTTITYNLADLVHAWSLLSSAAVQQPKLW
jgi:alpha-N-acetylglucosaminidase